MSMSPSHIRVPRRPSVNLCGAPVSELDTQYKEAIHIVTANTQTWPVCQRCRDLYLDVQSARLARGARRLVAR